MKCVSDCYQIWSIFLALTVVSLAAEDLLDKTVRGRTAYALDGGPVKNESLVTEVSSPFGNTKEGFITEVTYSSGEDLATRLFKKKDLVKFTPVLGNSTNAHREQHGATQQTKQRPTKKKLKPKVGDQENSTVERKVRVPLRERYKIQPDFDKIKKENPENSISQLENYPNIEQVSSLKNLKPLPTTNLIGNKSDGTLAKDRNESVFLKARDPDQTRKGRSDTDQAVLGAKPNQEQKTRFEPAKKIWFPKPVKELAILKPELKQTKKIVKFEEIVSKQKQMKPELKPTVTTTELSVQIKKLNFLRKPEPKVVVTTTEQTVKIKKIDFTNRPSVRSVKTTLDVADYPSEYDRSKPELNKEPSSVKKYASPQIKQVPVRTISHSEVLIPSFQEAKFKKHDNHIKAALNDYTGRGGEVQVQADTASRTPPTLRQSPLRNEFKLVDDAKTNSGQKVNNNQNKLKYRINYDDSNGTYDEFDYTSAFAESELLFGSKANGGGEQITRSNLVKSQDSLVSPLNNEDKREKKPLRRFKNKKTDIKHIEENVTENYPIIKPRKELKNSFNDYPTENYPVIKPQKELKNSFNDYPAENYPVIKPQEELKHSFNDYPKENYPLVKPQKELKNSFNDYSTENDPTYTPKVETKKQVNEIVINNYPTKNPRKEPKKGFNDYVTENYPTYTAKIEVKKHENEIVTENYPIFKSIQRPEDEPQEEKPHKTPPNENKRRKKLKRKSKKKEEGGQLLNRLTNTFQKITEDSSYINNDNDSHLKNDKKREQMDTSTSHYPVDHNHSGHRNHLSNHYTADGVTDAPYRSEITSNNYNQDNINHNSQTSIEDFEKFLRELSSSLNIQKNIPGTPNRSPLPTSSTNQVDYFTPSHNEQDWQPITYDYIPNKSPYNSNFINNNYNTHNNYNNDYNNVNVNNNFDYDYHSNIYNNQNHEMKYNLGQKGSSVFSSGVNNKGQSYYGYRIRAPSLTNDDFTKTTYNRPHDYHPNFKQQTNHNFNHYDKKPTYNFNSFVPNHKPSYDSFDFTINKKPNIVQTPFFNHKNNFDVSPVSYHQPVDGSYVATSHQSLIRLNEQDHPLKSYHDFVVHHRY